MKYYVKKPGEAFASEMTLEELQAGFTAGTIPPDSSARREDAADNDWVTAGQLCGSNPTPAQEQTAPLGLGDWMITLLVLAIPIVNVIMCVVWALSRSGNVNRRNFCMASLIYILILAAMGLAAHLSGSL